MSASRDETIWKLTCFTNRVKLRDEGV